MIPDALKKAFPEGKGQKGVVSGEISVRRQDHDRSVLDRIA